MRRRNRGKADNGIERRTDFMAYAIEEFLFSAVRRLRRRKRLFQGLGLRFNLDYFVLRFDGGMKAINPAVPSGKGHWPLLHPRFSRDFAFHFAVGLPF